MSDEPTGARSQADSPAAGTASNSGGTYHVGVISAGSVAMGGDVHMTVSPESLAIAAALAVYSRAFLEELGRRSGESVADLSRRIGIRMKARKGKRDELHVGVEGTALATIVVSDDTPDEARLALLDLDVTAEALRGKTLRWNATAGAWLPDDGLVLP